MFSFLGFPSWVKGKQKKPSTAVQHFYSPTPSQVIYCTRIDLDRLRDLCVSIYGFSETGRINVSIAV